MNKCNEEFQNKGRGVRGHLDVFQKTSILGAWVIPNLYPFRAVFTIHKIIIFLLTTIVGIFNFIISPLCFAKNYVCFYCQILTWWVGLKWKVRG